MIAELACMLRREHRWRPYAQLRTAQHESMRYASREFCECCEMNRLVFQDGVLEVARRDVVNLSPEWLEGLYRARWGDWPRQRVTVGGAFPSEWGW